MYAFILFLIVCRIFGSTLSLILNDIENYLLNCYDCIGILLFIKVIVLIDDITHRVLLCYIDYNLLILPYFGIGDTFSETSNATKENTCARCFL
jgi:hypothetical protein